MVIAGNPALTKVQNARKIKKGDHTLVRGKDGEVVSFKNGEDQFLIIPYEMALNAYKLDEHLIISEGLILEDRGQLRLISRSANSNFHIFPAIDNLPEASFAALSKINPEFKGASSYQLLFEQRDHVVTVKKVTDRKYSVVAKGDLDELNDVFVEIDYVGDRGMAFIDGLLVTDHFYHEKNWEISMKNFIHELSGKEMVLIFHPLRSDQEALVDFSDTPEFTDNTHLSIRNIVIVNEYKAIISF